MEINQAIYTEAFKKETFNTTLREVIKYFFHFATGNWINLLDLLLARLPQLCSTI